MARILVTETLADTGLELIRDAGHDVDVRTDLSPGELLHAVGGAHALIVRSATKVTADVLAAGTDLVVVGRAGSGVDNVDLAAATARGVMVVNAPNSISVSTAEHTMALLLALARNIPQAHASLTGGEWDRGRFAGVELHGKTLGILGIGRVGMLVAQRAHAFGMRIVAYDPWMPAERFRQLGIEMLGLEELMGEADFVSIHLDKTVDSIGLIGEELLAKAKAGLRIVNCARGGIIDEAALAAAIQRGTVAGAALDVFETEPTTESPLFGLANVVVTPHLAASTGDAQDKAGETIAEQVLLALAGDFVPFALNVDAAQASEAVRPFLPLAERLGRLVAALGDAVPGSLDVVYAGDLAADDTRILTLSVLKGVLATTIADPVSFVNAPQLAESNGMAVRETTEVTSTEYANLITLRTPDHAIAGTLTGKRSEARIVMVDDHEIEMPLANHLCVVRNDDRVGMMALVTATLAEQDVNIADMRLGRSPGGKTALAVISSDQPIPAAVRDDLIGRPGILDVHIIG